MYNCFESYYKKLFLDAKIIGKICPTKTFPIQIIQNAIFQQSFAAVPMLQYGDVIRVTLSLTYKKQAFLTRFNISICNFFAILPIIAL